METSSSTQTQEASSPKRFMVVPKNGLANRLRTLVAFIAIAKELKAEVLVYWEVTAACPGTFQAHFEELEHITFVDFETAKAIRRHAQGRGPNPFRDDSADQKIQENGVGGETATVFCGQASLKNVVKKFGVTRKINDEEIDTLYALLRPVSRIREEILKFCKMHQMESRIGLHIRRTDHVKAAVSCGKFTDDEFFRSRIDQIIKMDTAARFFLATDNAVTQQRYLKHYGDRMVIFQKIEAKDTKPKDPTRHTSLRNAVIDV